MEYPCAGYIAARLRGYTVIASAQQGHRLASRVIQYPGAIVPLTAMPE
ncbi:2-dehydro-3-deoxygluconokinase [Erwinia piriflorinigrans CFBP 5888]|uniref:2-dehydro-3-deoxygluconokinase n=1 Tax=Erwinia piriflorinigrans CFBP 5888 TaxID=1161919 RepID=V5ZA09_9GAMM|nr:2-dehydro-3-deoxygluconokinase [Erwinia piriflorinigrans CFBP 5888]